MLGIKKLDIFIAKQFGMLFMGTFFICQFVLMMQFLWRYVDELIGKGAVLLVHGTDAVATSPTPRHLVEFPDCLWKLR